MTLILFFSSLILFFLSALLFYWRINRPKKIKKIYYFCPGKKNSSFFQNIIFFSIDFFLRKRRFLNLIFKKIHKKIEKYIPKAIIKDIHMENLFLNKEHMEISRAYFFSEEQVQHLKSLREYDEEILKRNSLQGFNEDRIFGFMFSADYIECELLVFLLGNHIYNITIKILNFRGFFLIELPDRGEKIGLSFLNSPVFDFKIDFKKYDSDHTDEEREKNFLFHFIDQNISMILKQFFVFPKCLKITIPFLKKQHDTFPHLSFLNKKGYMNFYDRLVSSIKNLHRGQCKISMSKVLQINKIFTQILESIDCEFQFVKKTNFLNRPVDLFQSGDICKYIFYGENNLIYDEIMKIYFLISHKFLIGNNAKEKVFYVVYDNRANDYLVEKNYAKNKIKIAYFQRKNNFLIFKEKKQKIVLYIKNQIVGNPYMVTINSLLYLINEIKCIPKNSEEDCFYRSYKVEPIYLIDQLICNKFRSRIFNLPYINTEENITYDRVEANLNISMYFLQNINNIENITAYYTAYDRIRQEWILIDMWKNNRVIYVINYAHNLTHLKIYAKKLNFTMLFEKLNISIFHAIKNTWYVLPKELELKLGKGTYCLRISNRDRKNGPLKNIKWRNLHDENIIGSFNKNLKNEISIKKLKRAEQKNFFKLKIQLNSSSLIENTHFDENDFILIFSIDYEMAIYVQSNKKLFYSLKRHEMKNNYVNFTAKLRPFSDFKYKISGGKRQYFFWETDFSTTVKLNGEVHMRESMGYVKTSDDFYIKIKNRTDDIKIGNFLLYSYFLN